MGRNWARVIFLWFGSSRNSIRIDVFENGQLFYVRPPTNLSVASVLSEILSSKKYQAKQKMYKLIAVVYHDGKEASKGHYITDVYNVAYSSWIRYDDSMVRPVKEHQVLHPKAPRVPYLLYYRRCDTIATPPQQAGSGSAAAEHHQVSSSSTTDRTTTTHSSSGRNSAGGR